jgi:hypothetical protein
MRVFGFVWLLHKQTVHESSKWLMAGQAAACALIMTEAQYFMRHKAIMSAVLSLLAGNH